MPEWNELFKDKKYQLEEPEACLKEFTEYLDNDFVLLDMGCGTGRHSFFLKDKVKEIIALDVSKSALNKIRERLKTDKISNIKTIESDIAKMPFEDNSFDAIISTNVMAHGTIDQLKARFQEAFRVLNKEGLFLLKTPPAEFIDLVKTNKTIELGKNTYKYINTPDGEIAHHFFTEQELKQIFSDFMIEKFEIRKERNKWMDRIVPEIVLIARKKK